MAVSDIEARQDLTSAAIATLGWKAEQIDVIRRSVAKDANPAELYQFLYLSKEYGLDPFKREIYFMKSGNSPAIITGIDGFRKCSKRDSAYEGVQAFAVKEGDEFSIDAASYSVSHKFGAKRGKVIGAWARADAKGRRPVIVYVDFEEFNKGGQTWGKMPAVMIAKVAESHAIRRQFGLAGLYTKEEMGVSDTAPVTIAAPVYEADFVTHDTVDPDQIADDPPAEAAPPAAAKPVAPVAPATPPAPPKPTGDGAPPDWKAFWAVVRPLKLGKNSTEEKAFIHREASSFFNCTITESLNDVPDLDNDMLQQFLEYLRTIAAN